MSKLEQLDRIVHTTPSGIDIERLFYAEPYADHVDTIKAMQGTVEDDGDGWSRTPPAADPYIENCYCNETRTTFTDPRVNTTAESIEVGGGDLIDKLQRKVEPVQGSAGCFITAHYRPLITAWESGSAPGEKWDWLDPKITPGVRQVPWPDGLYVRHSSGLSDAVPAEAASPLGVPISDVSIRRTLVGEVPWETVEACANAVNINTFPNPGSVDAGMIPACLPRTLKFINAEVLNQMDTDGQRWFDIQLNFQWISLWTDLLGDGQGNLKPGWVTWNHIFITPALVFNLFEGRTGWYEVYLGRQKTVDGVVIPFIQNIPGLEPSAGRLHNEVNFDPLFELNSP